MQLEQRNTSLAQANWQLEQRVAERMAALQSALRAKTENEARFRAVADDVPQLVWTSKDEGNWTYANQRWLSYTGQSEEETLGLGWLDAVHPDDRRATLAAWHEASESGRPLLVEHRLRQADGAWRWFETQAMPSTDARTGSPWIGASTDIHARKLAGDALRDEKARLE